MIFVEFGSLFISRVSFCVGLMYTDNPILIMRVWTLYCIKSVLFVIYYKCEGIINDIKETCLKIENR